MTSRWNQDRHESPLFQGFLMSTLPIYQCASMFHVNPLTALHTPVNLEATSLFLLSSDHAVRRAAIRLMYNRWFRWGVLLLILFNSLTLSLRDPSLAGASGLQKFLSWSDALIVIVFLLECCVKIGSLGLVLHPKSYLRDPWNVLDLLVVGFGLQDLATIASSEGGGDAFTAFRVIRVLRPLRSMSFIPSLRSLVNRMMQCLPAVLNVTILTTLMVWFAAAIGLQSFSGALDGRCYADVSQVVSNASFRDVVPCLVGRSNELLRSFPGSNASFARVWSDTAVCGLVRGRSCGEPSSFETLMIPSTACSAALSNESAPLPSFPLLCLAAPAQDRGIGERILNFNNIFHAMLLAFKITCKDNWPNDFNHLADGIGQIEAFAFMFGTTLLVAYLCVNFFTAIFESSFSSIQGDSKLDEILLNRSEDETTEQDGDAAVTSPQPCALVRFTSMLGAEMIKPVGTLVCLYKPDQGEDDGDRGAEAFLLASIPSAARLQEEEALTVAYRRELPDVVEQYTMNDDISTKKSLGIWRRMRKWCSRFFARQGYAPVRRVVQSAQYNLFFLLIVMANICALSASEYPQSQERSDTIQRISFALGIFFLIEATVKIIGLGPSYFLSRWNILDFILCVITLPELFFGSASSLSPLRALRVIRLLKVGHRWTSLRKLLFMVSSAFSSVLSVVAVGLVVMFSYTLFGFELFNQPVPNTSFSFASVGESFLSVFIFVTGEDTNDVSAILSEEHSMWSSLYFVSLMVFGNFIWMNLFVAVILDHFAVTEDSAAAVGGVEGLFEDDEDEMERLATALASWTSWKKESDSGATPRRSSREVPLLVDDSADRPRSPLLTTQEMREKGEEVTEPIPYDTEVKDGDAALRSSTSGDNSADMMTTRPRPSSVFASPERSIVTGSGSKAETRLALKDWGGIGHPSLWLELTPQHPFRRVCIAILTHGIYDIASLVLTVASAVLLGLDNPKADNRSDALANTITATDTMFCVLFVLEAALKVVALGLVQHPGSYLRSPWNVMDLVATTGAIVAQFFPPMKWLRAFRIFRLLNVSFTLRVITRAVASAIPQMGAVLAFLLILFVIWAVMGLELYRGKFYACNDPSFSSAVECIGTFNETLMTPLGIHYTVNTTRAWQHMQPTSTSYDTIWESLYSVFKLSNNDGWFHQMYDAMHAEGTNEIVAVLFYISFAIIGRCFAVHLFVGVLVDRFVLQRQRGEGYGLLTDSQAQWILIQKVLMRSGAKRRPLRPSDYYWFQAKLYDMVNHVGFEIFFGVVTVANAIVVSLYGIVDDRDALDTTGMVIIGLLAVEVACRLGAMGPRHFFTRKMNCLDFFVIIGSIIVYTVANLSAPIVRVFRVLRLLNLFRRVDSIKVILDTFYHAIPELANVTIMLTSVYFVFAVVAVQLFYDVPTSSTGDFTANINFSDVPHAMVTLYIMMTEEYWAEIIDAASTTSSYAIPFAIVYMVTISWIGAHLLVTVVIDVFGETEDTVSLGTSLQVMEDFRDLWHHYDTTGSQVVVCDTLVRYILPKLPSRVWDRTTAAGLLLSSLNHHNGRGKSTPFLVTLRQLQLMHIRMDKDKQCRYDDCLASVALRLFSIPVAEAISASQQAVHGVTWTSAEFCAHHEYAAVLLTRNIRKFLKSQRERRRLTRER